MKSNCIHFKVWDEITYPFMNFNGDVSIHPYTNVNGGMNEAGVEVVTWIGNHIQHKAMDVVWLLISILIPVNKGPLTDQYDYHVN